jgi:Heavy metal associated domain 2
MDHLRVAHDIPGRLRVRVPPDVPVEGLAAAIAAEPGITNCAWSPRTRSMLVLYRPDSIGSRDIVQSIARHTGADAPSATAASRETAAPRDADTLLGVAVRDAFGELDDRVRSTTRGLVSLGGLVPLTLLAWAVREVLRGRAAPLAWSSALWYAHGLFRDYNASPSED